MATTAVVARPAPRPQRRQRDEEVLVWPDLVFVEFISAMVFTIGIFILSFAINAPLLDEANPDVTNNPAKAPWYLLNLQELLLHMDPALAGIIVPTVWLVLLAIFPYFDQDQEGQGAWFATENSWRITLVSAAVGFVGTWLLILWNTRKLAEWIHDYLGISGGDTFRWLADARSIQNELPWPEWSTDIPFLPFRAVILGDTFETMDFPAWLVEQGIPVMFMVGLPCLLIFALWKMEWVHTRRDALMSLFSGFVAVMAVLTIVGTAFRGEGQELMWPWQVEVSEGIPGEE
ncbi:MAG: hypothetical protein ACOC5B_00250 [Myxococcota bacterium]